MSSRTLAVLLACLLLAACSRRIEYGKAYIGMTTSELNAAYPDSEVKRRLRNKSGTSLVIYEAEEEGLQVVRFYVRDGELFGMVFVFDESVEFATVEAEMTDLYGAADVGADLGLFSETEVGQIFRAMLGVAWESGGYAIELTALPGFAVPIKVGALRDTIEAKGVTLGIRPL